MATVSEIVALAGRQAGVKEIPAGSNRVKYNDWYYGREVSGAAYPWCMTFMQWLANETGLSALRTPSCTALANWAKGRGQWVTKDYRSGDWAMFDFSGKRGKTEHVGLVVETGAGVVVTIEGNTGAGNDANGGQVQKRERKLHLITGAWRPEYEEEDETVVTYQYLKDVPAAFRPCIAQLMDAGIIQGDGSDKGGNEDVIDLTHEQVRTLMFLYRGGGFDRKLIALGVEPIVSA